MEGGKIVTPAAAANVLAGRGVVRDADDASAFDLGKKGAGVAAAIVAAEHGFQHGRQYTLPARTLKCPAPD